MTKLEDIEKAITELSAEELKKLRTWLDELEAQAFDEKIERDAKSGKLDKLIAAAKENHRAGRRREV